MFAEIKKLKGVFTMKKLFSVLAVLFVMGTTSVFAFGIGAQAGYVVNTGAGGAVTFKVDKVPCVFAVDAAFNTNYVRVGGTADWWMANPKISGTWGYYYGVGLAAGAGIWSGDASAVAISFGPRVVLGTNVFVLKNQLEFYLQGAWQPTFSVYVNGNEGWADPAWLCFPINIGFRFWF